MDYLQIRNAAGSLLTEKCGDETDELNVEESKKPLKNDLPL